MTTRTKVTKKRRNITEDEEGNADDNSYGGPAEYFALAMLCQLGVELVEVSWGSPDLSQAPRSQQS